MRIIHLRELWRGRYNGDVLWTMVINAIRNKRCGPGGGTRRLHQASLILRSVLKRRKSESRWGRYRIDVRNKGMVFTRYDTAVKGRFISANDNIAPAELKLAA